MADLNTLHRPILDVLQEAASEVLSSGHFVHGEHLRAFEELMADYIGVDHAIGVSSGTDALLLALRALEIGPGDEVIIPAFTIFVDAEVVMLLGATPILVDIDPQTFNINTSLIKSAITEKTKAIIAVDLFGCPADFGNLRRIANEYHLALIEDAAQALGAVYHDKFAGSLGDVGCFSFYPTKNVGACGDGGLITTNDSRLARQLRLLRFHGDVGNYTHTCLGRHTLLNEIQAAILEVKMAYLKPWNDKRRSNAALYQEGLRSLSLQIPEGPSDGRHVYHQFTIAVPGCRDELRAHLRGGGIETAIYYPTPIYHQKPWSERYELQQSFPVAEKAAHEVLSLPVHPALTDEQVEYVIQKIRRFFEYEGQSG